MLDQAAWKALTFVGILGGAVYTGSLYTSAVLSDVSRVPRDYDTISNGTNLPRLPGISAVTDVFSSRVLELPTCRISSDVNAQVHPHITTDFVASFNFYLYWSRLCRRIIDTDELLIFFFFLFPFSRSYFPFSLTR